MTTKRHTNHLLTVAQAAERLGTTERFPRRLIAERRITFVKLGTHVRIPERALDEFIARQHGRGRRMSKARPQDVRVWAIQDRSGHTNISKRWVVRWVVDTKRFSKSFRTRAEGDRYRSRLLVAHEDGERFDTQVGQPISWLPAPDELQLHEWARQWVAEEWQDWAPRSRRSAVEALSRFLPLACDPAATDPPDEMRAHLRKTLPPGGVDADGASAEAEDWLRRWGLTLGALGRELLADVDRQLGIGDAGQALAASTAGRYRKVARRCVRRAYELGRLPSDPWPPTPRGRSQRKARRKRRVVDIRRLPDPTTMAAIVKAIRSHQPGSRTYQVMTAVAYVAGLRPSEVVMLRPRALRLPAKGWGAIDVVEADVDWDEPGEPKTGPRSVPIPPELVATLRTWVTEHDLASGDLMFRTRTGRRPAPSNWARALQRACRAVGREPMRVYDCRHACATTWLRAGVPLGEVARRLGHSVETLVSTYVGALDGDDAVANKLIHSALGPSRAWIADLGSAKPAFSSRAPAKCGQP